MKVKLQLSKVTCLNLERVGLREVTRLLRVLPDLLEGPGWILRTHVGQLTNFIRLQEMPSVSSGLRHRWVSKADVSTVPELYFCSDESDRNQGPQASTEPHVLMEPGRCPKAKQERTTFEYSLRAHSALETGSFGSPEQMGS